MQAEDSWANWYLEISTHAIAVLIGLGAYFALTGLIASNYALDFSDSGLFALCILMAFVLGAVLNRFGSGISERGCLLIDLGPMPHRLLFVFILLANVGLQCLSSRRFGLEEWAFMLLLAAGTFVTCITRQQIRENGCGREEMKISGGKK